MSVEELMSSGAGKEVRAFAVEAVRGNPPGAPVPARSPLSRAIARIRQRFALPSGTTGYQMAYNVFRRAVRAARRALRIEQSAGPISPSAPSPAQPPQPRPRGRAGSQPQQPTRVNYTVYVNLTSPRSSRSFRGQVTVSAYSNTPVSEVIRKATDTIRTGKVNTPNAKSGGKNAGPFGNSFTVADWSVLSVEDA